MFELSEKVDSSDYTAVYKFDEMCKEIVASKDLNETLKKQEGSSFERFFKSNQDTNDVQGNTSSKAGEEYGDEILKKMDKEDEAVSKVA